LADNQVIRLLESENSRVPTFCSVKMGLPSVQWANGEVNKSNYQKLCPNINSISTLVQREILG